MKGFKGGYKIVSLQLNDITSDFTLTGIYNDIKESHDKPILVSEIVVSGEKMNDAYTIVKKDDTDFIIEVYGYALTVASDDSVTIAEISQGVTSIGGVEGAITLGTGLAITEEGELSASGGSGDLYEHHINVVYGTGSGGSYQLGYEVLFKIITSSSTKITTASALKTAIDSIVTDVPSSQSSFELVAQGVHHVSDTTWYSIIKVSQFSNTGFSYTYINESISNNPLQSNTASGFVVSDTVLKLV